MQEVIEVMPLDVYSFCLFYLLFYISYAYCS
jgi:hypothetical protein